jgi:hypothetical protein
MHVKGWVINKPYAGLPRYPCPLLPRFDIQQTGKTKWLASVAPRPTAPTVVI